MHLSARNQLKGRIVSVEHGPIHSKVKIDIGGGNELTESISTEAVDELNLGAGMSCYAVIKATSVMVGVEE